MIHSKKQVLTTHLSAYFSIPQQILPHRLQGVFLKSADLCLRLSLIHISFRLQPFPLHQLPAKPVLFFHSSSFPLCQFCFYRFSFTSFYFFGFFSLYHRNEDKLSFKCYNPIFDSWKDKNGYKPSKHGLCSRFLFRNDMCYIMIFLI